MKTVLKSEDADVEVEDLGSGTRKVTVKLFDAKAFMFYGTCETRYPIDLIRDILAAKGPGWLCDEIMREESAEYIQANLRYDLLSYTRDEEFAGKRLLDFGCGSGASTMALCRMFPSSEVLGIELNEKFLSVAKHRARHYGFDNVTFLRSPDPDTLPTDIGEFDFVILNAVLEHLLPHERRSLLPQLWKLLKPDGILFVTETPYRYFPVEFHTTGLPLINYFPDTIACFYARRFSGRSLKNQTWGDLLKGGIRGASIRGILRILNMNSREGEPVLLKPTRLGVKDRIDLWSKQMEGYLRRSSLPYSKGKVLLLKNILSLLTAFLKTFKAGTGIIFLPRLSLAVKKARRAAH